MIYIALGSNMGDRETYLYKALRTMEQEGINVIVESSLYETAPVGYTEQPSFYNMVVGVLSDQTPDALLETLQRIELRFGRERLIKNGPRTLDLDILLYNGEDIQSKHLTVPHPRMHERAFVLVPLAEIAPEEHVQGMTIQSLCDRLPESERQEVVRVGRLTQMIDETGI